MPGKPAYTPKRAWNYLIWLLSRKAYSKVQLRKKLQTKGVSEKEIEPLLTRLEDLQYINDENFAEMYIKSRQNKKGRLALKQELYHKGIAEPLIDKTLATLSNETEVKTASNLLDKYAWRLEKTSAERRYAKAYAFLARRGFSLDIIKTVLSQRDF